MLHRAQGRSASECSKKVSAPCGSSAIDTSELSKVQVSRVVQATLETTKTMFEVFPKTLAFCDTLPKHHCSLRKPTAGAVVDTVQHAGPPLTIRDGHDNEAACAEVVDTLTNTEPAE